MGEYFEAGSKTILVVEDDDQLREVVVEYLREYDYMVLGAADARTLRGGGGPGLGPPWAADRVTPGSLPLGRGCLQFLFLRGKACPTKMCVFVCVCMCECV